MSDVRVATVESHASSHGSVVRRARQGIAAVVHRHDPAHDVRLRTLLADERQWALLERLPSFDRAHHLAVHDALVRMGCRDRDVFHAALLHDVGKADGRGRVWLIHRVVKVLAERWSPAVLQRLARRDGDWLRHGLWLAARHAEVGADLAAAASANERVCYLIRWHGDLGRGMGDPALAMLQHADERSIR